MLNLMLDHPNWTLAFIAVTAFTLVAVFLGWLNWLIYGPETRGFLRTLARWLVGARADFADMEGETDDGGDHDRPLNPATRERGLTRQQRDLDLDALLESIRHDDASTGLAPEVALDERMRQLGDMHRQNHGGLLRIGAVRSDYDPQVDYREEDPDQPVEDGDRVEPGDDDGYPRAVAVPPPPLPPYVIQGDWTDDAQFFGDGPVLTEEDAGAYLRDWPTGSWRALNDKRVSA